MKDATLEDISALEELIACADPTAPIDHVAVYASLRNAAPALFAAARARDVAVTRLAALCIEYEHLKGENYRLRAALQEEGR